MSKTTLGRLIAATVFGSVLLVSPALAGPGKIARRKENQQDRIAQGVKSGQLTAGETANLERKEAGLNKEVRGMRQEDVGKLTKGDRTLINHQQNQLSRQIYKDKHNSKTQPN